MGHDLSEPRARVVAVVQARMSSSRLPGKALAMLGEQSALELLLSRLALAGEIAESVVATSTDASDDPIVDVAHRLGVGVVRGSLSDVLGRFVQAAEQSRADAVVRITADCPFTDPEVVDQVVDCWRRSGADYAANILDPRSYPDGFDVEVLARGALVRCSELATDTGDREHVTPYVRSHPQLFSIAELRLEPTLGDVRVTLDTEDDLRTLRALVRDVGPRGSLGEVLRALGHSPSVVATCKP